MLLIYQSSLNMLNENSSYRDENGDLISNIQTLPADHKKVMRKMMDVRRTYAKKIVRLCEDEERKEGGKKFSYDQR